jgi:ATP-binding cassette subfamily B protein
VSVTGVEGEERGDYTREESRQIRARSLRLLGSLLRPVRARVILTLFVVVVCPPRSMATTCRSGSRWRPTSSPGCSAPC